MGTFDTRKCQPVVLEGNVDCTLGQQPPVYFLAGKAAKLPENPSELPIILTGARTCTLPQGVTLFFPIVNGEFVNEPGDTTCTNGSGGRPCTVAKNGKFWTLLSSVRGTFVARRLRSTAHRPTSL
jgi:hypothetical protein